MGVLGLAPFIQKACPAIIQILPNRLQSLSGKTVVIDGTLITQRLHFAPMQHQYRHVIGWYRIAKELRDCDVHAICVFDGEERSVAKDRELERRRSIRKVTAARGALENDRLRRLRRLDSLIHVWHSLDTAARESVSDTIRNIISNPGKTPCVGLPSSANPANGREKTPALPKYSHIPAQHAISPYKALDDFGKSDISEVLERVNTLRLEPLGCETSLAPLDNERAVSSPCHGQINATAEEPVAKDFSSGILSSDGFISVRDLIELTEKISIEAILPPEAVHQKSVITPEDVSKAIASLYFEYRRSIPQLTVLPEPLVDFASTMALAGSIDQEAVAVQAEERTEQAMSKTQYQLTLDEGSFWDNFSGATLSDLPAEAPESALSALEQKSSLISESYRRRTHPPTAETYSESWEILRAMGVPCVESKGPFEAEALASSLVLQGYADYVASEDTDVLIYEAPLLRNITNRNGPLVVISGTDVRDFLQLDRARYVDFALLLGTDFSQRIKNVGPARALKFIRMHGSIERVLECETQYPPRVPQDSYLAQVSLARLVFSTLPPTPDAELLQQQDYDEEEVFRVLSRYGLQCAVDDGDYSDALAGNFFNDDPAAF